MIVECEPHPGAPTQFTSFTVEMPVPPARHSKVHFDGIDYLVISEPTYRLVPTGVALEARLDGATVTVDPLPAYTGEASS